MTNDTGSSASVFPNCTAYNIRFLGLSDILNRDRKLANVGALCNRNAIVALTEVHASFAVAQSHFIAHIANVSAYYLPDGGDHVILLRNNWFQNKYVSHHVFVPGCAHGIAWQDEGIPHLFISFRFDASSTQIRCLQLSQLLSSLRGYASQFSHVHLRVVMLGDRNFLTSSDERVGSMRTWHPLGDDVTYWGQISSFLRGYQIIPAECTWARNTNIGFVSEILNAGICNLTSWELGTRSVPLAVAKYVPHPNASDHMPIELHILDLTKKRRHASRVIPNWLYEHEQFLSCFEVLFDSWYGERSRGAVGLEEFAGLARETATWVLDNVLCVASSPEHRFQISSALYIQASRRCNRINFKYYCKLSKIDPHLLNIIPLDFDENGDLMINMSDLHDYLTQLNDEIVHNRMQIVQEERQDDFVHDSLQHDKATAVTLRSLSKLIPRNLYHVSRMWDSEAGDYTTDSDRIADILTEAAIQRQGNTRGNPLAGEELLNNSSLDLSCVNLEACLVDALNAIRDGNPISRPGPNGIIGLIYHRYASKLALLLLQAFNDLLADLPLPSTFHEALLHSVGKRPNPTEPKYVRDLELPNFDIKVLERMFCNVLDAAASHTLSRAQCAGPKNRDIAHHVLQLNPLFESSVLSDTLLAILSLDCTKGFNFMAHSWIFRVLAAAGCPRPLLSALTRLVSALVSFIHFLGATERRVCFLCGLRQGGPLSLLLYVLCVDPLLCTLQKISGILLCLGFVDDMLAAVRDLQYIISAQRVCEVFSDASGQEYNKDKSVVLVTRLLSASETLIVSSRWADCKVVTKHKIIGILYDVNMHSDDRFQIGLTKARERIEIFRSMQLSLPMRIIVCNVCMLSFFSFLGRFFNIPDRIVNAVMELVRGFITKLSFAKVCVWTHGPVLLKCRVRLVDLRLQNLCLLVATGLRFPDSAGTDFQLDASSPWKILNTTFCLSLAVVAFRNRVPGKNISPKLHKNYDVLLESEMPYFLAYFRQRLTHRGCPPQPVLDNLSNLPANVNSHLRLFALQWVLNGLACYSRVRHFVDFSEVQPFYLCGSCTDSIDHLPFCHVTCELADSFGVDVLHINHVPCWNPVMSTLQISLDGSFVAAILRMNFAIWMARTLIATGHEFYDKHDLMRFLRNMSTRTQYTYKQERNRNIAPPAPIPSNAVLYRGDGSYTRCRGEAEKVGFGCVCLDANEITTAWMCRNITHEASNNIAEYSALRSILERVVRMRHPYSHIQLDSLLVCQQFNGAWRVLNDRLQVLWQECHMLMQRIDLLGLRIKVYHIYREFNVQADALAGRGAAGENNSYNW